MAVNYPRWVLELDVPRQQAIRTAYSSAYYGSTMRIDQVDAKDVPPEGGMTLPASTDVWQEPLTGFIGLKPDFLYDSTSHKGAPWVGYEMPIEHMQNICTAIATQADSHNDRSGMVPGTVTPLVPATAPTYRTKWNANSLFSITNRRTQYASGISLISLLSLVAVEAILIGVLSDSISPDEHELIPITISDRMLQPNQGFRILLSSGSALVSRAPIYASIRWGRFMLSLSTDGNAKLYGLPHPESFSTKPNSQGDGVELIDEWQFAGKPGFEAVVLTVIPVHGNLCLYLQTPQARVSSMMVQTGHWLGTLPGLPTAKTGHLVRVPSKYMIQAGEELHTTQMGKLHVFGNIGFSHDVKIYLVQYPVTGTYVSAAEQMDMPTIDGQGGTVETFDYVPPGCTATSSLVDGDVADIDGKPTAWDMAAGHQHPRIQTVMTRPSGAAYMTPYHTGHCFKFDPVFMPDQRTMLTFANPYRVSITQNQNQSTWSGNCELMLGLDGADVVASAAYDTLADAYEIFMVRPDAPYRLWHEADDNRLNDTLLMAGYLDTKAPPTIEWITDRMAKFKFSLKPMHQRLEETHFLRTNIYDNRSLLYAIKDMIGACGFDPATELNIADADVAMGAETFPNETGELTARYVPKPNSEVGQVVEATLQLFNEQNREVELVWTAMPGDIAADGRLREKWVIRPRRNPPSETVPPTIAWHLCMHPDTMAAHPGTAALITERPTLRIYPVAANVVHVITDADDSGGALEIGEGAFNTDSMDMTEASLADPTRADYLGRYKRLFYVNPELRGDDRKAQCAALAQDILEVEGQPYYELDVKAMWQPGMHVNDYVQVYLSNGTAWRKFWIAEISVDYDDMQTRIARLTLRSIWQREQKSESA